jgi:hypothetical protein
MFCQTARSRSLFLKADGTFRVTKQAGQNPSVMGDIPELANSMILAQ